MRNFAGTPVTHPTKLRPPPSMSSHRSARCAISRGPRRRRLPGAHFDNMAVGWPPVAARAVMTEKLDLVVIGGGSGGLAAAQRAAEYGAKVVLAESGRLGGTCVNVGCVPKKIMWNAAELGSALHDAREYGFDVETRGFDWASLKAGRDAFVERLNGIYAANLAKRGIEVVHARASFIDAHTVSAGGRQLRADHIFIATGSRPRLPMVPGAELGISSDGFFELSQR